MSDIFYKLKSIITCTALAKKSTFRVLLKLQAPIALKESALNLKAKKVCCRVLFSIKVNTCRQQGH